MSQDPDVGEGVHVVRRGGGQSCAIAFRIVISNECVGGTAGAGRVTQGFRVLKRGDSVLFECGLEGESVLEGPNLAEPDVFRGGDFSSSAVINFLSDVAGLPRELAEDGLKVRCGDMFCGVNAESVSTQTQQLVGVSSDLSPNIVSPGR